MNMPIHEAVMVRKIMIVPTPDDISAFMHTFDQARTLSGDDETYREWARRNKVDQREVDDEAEMMRSFLGLSSFLKLDGNRVDLIAATYDVGCYSHGGEGEYLDFLQFILAQS